jgi:hypothetical protein
MAAENAADNADTAAFKLPILLPPPGLSADRDRLPGFLMAEHRHPRADTQDRTVRLRQVTGADLARCPGAPFPSPATAPMKPRTTIRRAARDPVTGPG